MWDSYRTGDPEKIKTPRRSPEKFTFLSLAFHNAPSLDIAAYFVERPTWETQAEQYSDTFANDPISELLTKHLSLQIQIPLDIFENPYAPPDPRSPQTPPATKKRNSKNPGNPDYPQK